MSKLKNHHSYEDFAKALHYNPSTGSLTWKVPMSNVSAGSPAGFVRSVGNGSSYRYLGFKGKEYLAHRVAWLLMNREWPHDRIDHKDGDGLNNAWSNLRSANGSQNMGNMGLSRHNTTGFKGVSRHKKSGKFTAQISIKDKKRHLGIFPTAEEAHAAYRLAAKEYFGAFARFE